jgi:hypothetical protein
MSMLKLVVVTASLDMEKTRGYWESWGHQAKGRYSTVLVRPAEEGEWPGAQATGPFIRSLTSLGDGHWDAVVVTNGIVGVVPAFAAGVKVAKDLGADIIACFHDDLRIDEPGWDTKILRWFGLEPKCGLAGFFGARSLGAGDIYQVPYAPMQLARGNCGSNMEEAGKHGERWLSPRKAICFDGFSQVGRAEFMGRAFERLLQLGVVHHMYDSALGAFAAKWGWEAWFLPFACHHAGGVTAVGNGKYQEWVKERNGEKGDKKFWEESHRVLYEELRGVLPLYVVE